MSTQKSSQLAKLSFASEEAIEKLLTVVHPRRAMNALLERKPEVFDAAIGDACCHARCPVVNDAADIVAHHFQSTEKLRDALTLIQEFKENHSDDMPDARIKQVSDIKDLGLGSAAYEELFAEVYGLFKPVHWQLIVAFFSKAADMARSALPWDTQIGRRGHKIYHASNPIAEASKKLQDRTDMDSSLVAQLGQQNIDYITDKLSSTEPTAYSVEHEVTQMLLKDRAKIVLHHGLEYQVGEIYALYLAGFYFDYAARRPFVMSVRRIRLEGDKQQWERTEVLFWEPNDNGSWDYVATPSSEQRNRVCTYYNMFSAFVPGAHGKGLDSSDSDEFMTWLKHANPAWVILQCAAVHPSFAKKATARDFARKSAWIKLSTTIHSTHKFTPTHCPGLSFAAQLTEQSHLDLATQFACAYSAGLPLKDMVVDDKLDNDIFILNDKAVRLSLHHVHSSTYSHVKARTDKLVAKYEKAGRPKFGFFAARYGSQVFVCESREEAQHFSAMKSKAQKQYIAFKNLSALYDK